MNAYMCPCCGFVGLDCPPYKGLTEDLLVRGLIPPYRNYFGWGSYDVCPCCGFEFGNDDEPGGDAVGDSFEKYLADWISRGQKWFTPTMKPAGWDLNKQLQNAMNPLKPPKHFGLPAPPPSATG